MSETKTVSNLKHDFGSMARNETQREKEIAALEAERDLYKPIVLRLCDSRNCNVDELENVIEREYCEGTDNAEGFIDKSNELVALEAENKRLTEALVKIANSSEDPHNRGGHTLLQMCRFLDGLSDISRTALEQK